SPGGRGVLTKRSHQKAGQAGHHGGKDQKFSHGRRTPLQAEKGITSQCGCAPCCRSAISKSHPGKGRRIVHISEFASIRCFSRALLRRRGRDGASVRWRLP